MDQETVNWLQLYSGVKRETAANARVLLMVHKRLKSTMKDESNYDLNY